MVGLDDLNLQLGGLEFGQDVLFDFSDFVALVVVLYLVLAYRIELRILVFLIELLQ